MPSRTTRIALLLAALAGAALWAASRTRARRVRVAWEQPVALAVLVLEGETPASPAQVASLRGSLEALAARLGEERRRHAPGARGPAFTVEVVGPLRPSRLPSPAAPPPGLAGRALHALDLWQATRSAHAAAEEAGGFAPAAYDVRIYLVAAPGEGQLAEGLGEAGGEVGVVRAALGGDGLLGATAALHEALHTLGASDKYDAAGHAVEPAGLVEPDLLPRYPQRLAEIMVGEVPLSPGAGRLPASAAEIGVGPATAAELGWSTR